MKNKKAVSQVISVLILVVLTMVAIGVVWAAINEFILDETENAEKCYNLFEKVTIKADGTCYNATSDTLRVYLELGDADLDAVLFSIDLGTSANTYKILNQSSTIQGVSTYPSGNTVSLPGKNGGKTYAFGSITDMPDQIRIAPQVGGELCDVSDSLSNIDNC